MTSIILLAIITIYIVDLSGFTDSWRCGVAHLLGISEAKLKPLKPFDCGQCMTWWVCNIGAIILHNWTLPMVAFIALLSFLSYPIGQTMIFIRETIIALLNKMMKNYE